MKRVAALAVAMIAVGSICFAQAKEAAPAAEKPQKQMKAAVPKPTGVPVRNDELYKEIGLSDEEIAKMKELREQMKEARKAKDEAKIKQLREEMDKIMTKERQAKMREIVKAKMQDKATTSTK
jgi:actin-related protein